jgi:hypothetical protein
MEGAKMKRELVMGHQALIHAQQRLNFVTSLLNDHNDPEDIYLVQLHNGIAHVCHALVAVAKVIPKLAPGYDPGIGMTPDELRELLDNPGPSRIPGVRG